MIDTWAETMNERLAHPAPPRPRDRAQAVARTVPIYVRYAQPRTIRTARDCVLSLGRTVANFTAGARTALRYAAKTGTVHPALDYERDDR